MSESKVTIGAITAGFKKFKDIILSDLEKTMEIVESKDNIETFLVKRAKNFVSAIERL